MDTPLTNVLDIDNIIYDYKYGSEHRDKFKSVLKELEYKANALKSNILGLLIGSKTYKQERAEKVFFKAFRAKWIAYCNNLCNQPTTTTDDSSVTFNNNHDRERYRILHRINKQDIFECEVW